MNIVDHENRIAVARDVLGDKEQAIGVLEYHEDPEAQTVMTGTLLTMPHIDTFEVALTMAMFVREKYPYEDGWRLITEPGSCATRPIWQVWIDKVEEMGIHLYDEVGDLTNLDIQATHEWPLGPAVMALDWTNQEFPATEQVRAILAQIDAEIDA